MSCSPSTARPATRRWITRNVTLCVWRKLLHCWPNYARRYWLRRKRVLAQKHRGQGRKLHALALEQAQRASLNILNWNSATTWQKNSMRPVAIGRKNWVHIGHEDAGPKIAAIFSIVESCRRLGLPIREYLAAVLPGLASRSTKTLDQLTPVCLRSRQGRVTYPTTPAPVNRVFGRTHTFSATCGKPGGKHRTAGTKPRGISPRHSCSRRIENRSPSIWASRNFPSSTSRVSRRSKRPITRSGSENSSLASQEAAFEVVSPPTVCRHRAYPLRLECGTAFLPHSDSVSSP